MISQRKMTERWFYFPVLRQGNRYVESPISSLMGLDRPTVSELENYIKRHYRCIQSNVELEGKTYKTDVYIPNLEDDYDLSYVIADSDGIPKGIESGEVVKVDHLNEYLHHLSSDVSYAEGISPDQTSYLKTEFMIPSFDEIDPLTGIKITEHSWEAAKHKSRVIIVGDPGAGKTTCMRKWTLDLVSSSVNQSTKQTIPIYIQLRQWQDNTDVLDNVRRELDKQGGSFLASNLMQLIESGRLLIMLDGLDELQTPLQERARNSIIDVASRYSRLGLIVTMRKFGYHWYFPGFSHLQIKPFSETAIKEWTCQRLYDDSDKSWKIFFSHLQEQPELLELVRNPLMLTMAVYVYKRRSLVPQNRSTLIGNYIEALVDLWDMVRGVTRSTEIFASPSYKYSSLCRIAFSLQQSGKTSFTRRDFIELEKRHMEENDAEEMLSVLIKHTGLFTKSEHQGVEEWSFQNRSIAEYLTARYIIERTDDTGNLFQELLKNKKWQDIWLFTCGAAQDATHLIDFVLKNKNLGTLTKSILLAEVFAQNLTVDNQVIQRSCSSIVASLESLIEPLDVTELSNLNEIEELLWEISFGVRADKLGNFTTRESNIRRLMRLIYNARAGSAKQYLERAMQNSTNKSIRLFSECLEFDGLYKDEIKKQDDDTLFLIKIFPETPQTEITNTMHLSNTD